MRARTRKLQHPFMTTDTIHMQLHTHTRTYVHTYTRTHTYTHSSQACQAVRSLLLGTPNQPPGSSSDIYIGPGIDTSIVQCSIFFSFHQQHQQGRVCSHCCVHRFNPQIRTNDPNHVFIGNRQVLCAIKWTCTSDCVRKLVCVSLSIQVHINKLVSPPFLLTFRTRTNAHVHTVHIHTRPPARTNTRHAHTQLSKRHTHLFTYTNTHNNAHAHITGTELDARTLGLAPPLLELALTTFGVVEVLLAGFAAAVAATLQVRGSEPLVPVLRGCFLQCQVLLVTKK